MLRVWPNKRAFLIMARGVRGGKVSHRPKGVSFVCDAAASLRNGPGVTMCPNFNVAAASSHFLDAKHMHIRVYARVYAYMRAYTRICAHIRVYASVNAYMRAYTRICRCFASRKCDDAAATLKLGHLVRPGPFLSDPAASHTDETPFGLWDTLPPLTVPPHRKVRN